jgi:hypothetical protein
LKECTTKKNTCKGVNGKLNFFFKWVAIHGCNKLQMFDLYPNLRLIINKCINGSWFSLVNDQHEHAIFVTSTRLENMS